MNICGGPKELPSEGPSGADNCSDTQWGYCGPNPVKMKGTRHAGPKMAAYFWRQRVERGELIHGLE